MMLTQADNCQIQVKKLGQEQTPILIVDHFVKQADELVALAKAQTFSRYSKFYPGLHAKAPDNYKKLLLNLVAPYLKDTFNFTSPRIQVSSPLFGLVTQASDNLHILQRIPHIDDTQTQALASVHYLFKSNLGGTGFYQHKATGYERITQPRLKPYLASLEAENGGTRMPRKQDGYINGDTPLYRQISQQNAVFNRLLVYPKNILHSGNIPSHFVPSLDPSQGRLTINTFIDCIKTP